MSIATPAFSVCCEEPVARVAEPRIAAPAPAQPVATNEPATAAGDQPGPVMHEVNSSGRLLAEPLVDSERNLAIAMHVSPFSFLWIGPIAMAIPLIIWVARRNRSPFYDDHGREITNFMISFIVMHLLLALTVVGIVLIPVFWVVSVVSLIRGAASAGRGEFFRYPATIRFLK